MAPVGIGLIGLGRHGMRYAQHLLEPLANARLVAVSRRDTALGASFAVTHRVRFYRDYRELIADPRVQAVVVVTHPSLTRSICLEAVQAGKPLLIEKPLATTGSAAREMVRAAVSAQVPLMTAQTLRFEATVLAMKAELAAVGPPQYFVLTSRVEPRPEVWREPTDYAGRGVLLEIGIHLLDLVRFLTGEEVAEVRCELDRAAPGKPESRALVSLRTSTNLAGIVDVSRVTSGRISRAEWVGTGGQMIADWVQHSLLQLAGAWNSDACDRMGRTAGRGNRGCLLSISGGWDHRAGCGKLTRLPFAFRGRFYVSATMCVSVSSTPSMI